MKGLEGTQKLMISSWKEFKEEIPLPYTIHRISETLKVPEMENYRQ
jgi:hypothetical protein